MEFDDSVAMVADLVAVVPLPVLVIGRSSRILAANAAAVARFGQGLAGRHYLMVLRQPVVQEAVEGCLAGAEAQTVRLVRTQAQEEINKLAQKGRLCECGKNVATVLA